MTETQFKSDASEASHRLTYDKSLRLLAKPDFDKVFADAPIRASHNSLLILSRINTQGHPRLGLVVAKKNVRKAVNRNKVKRAVRESFRLQQKNLPPIDAIVLARRGIDTLPPRELRAILDNLWKRIKKKAGSVKR